MCGLGAAGLLGGLMVAAAWVVLAPLALIGCLVGPATHLPLGKLLLYLALWLGAMALAAIVLRASFKRCAALYRPPSTRPGSGPQAWPWPPAAKWSSIAVGALASLLVAVVGLGVAFPPSAQDRADAAPLPASEEGKRSFEQDWLPQARVGDAYAQFVVGTALQEGLMAQAVDRRAARDWLNKAAAQGDPDAQLGLLVAQRTGSLGDVQQFDIEDRLIEFAATQTGWRRAAVELLLAYNPKVVAGSGAPNHVEQTRRANQWLENAALHGSRYAAFQLARSLEQARDADQHPAPDAAGAIRWYAVAGAEREVQRLQAGLPQPASLADLPVPREERASPDALARMLRRAQMVAVRQRAHSVSMATDDAFVHFVAHAEASRQYELLAKATEQQLPSTRLSGDTRLAAMYRALAAQWAPVELPAKPR